MYKKIKDCRICKSKKISQIINLGNQPLANNLLKKNNVIEEKFPLILVFCKDCKTAQLSCDVDKKKLFSKYFWVTSTSTAAKKFSKLFFNLSKKFLRPNSFIIEIASNDGLFLKQFNKYKTLGVEPAKNLSIDSNKAGILTLNRFFDIDTSKFIKKKYGKSDYIFARNVIPHISSVKSVIKGISDLLSDDGVVAVEFHYANNIIKQLQFDSIYHEHVFYFSIVTLSNLFRQFELKSFDLALSPISGGSMIVFFSKNNRKKTSLLKKWEIYEKKKNINSLKNWLLFSRKIKKYKKKLISMIKKLTINKNRINAYGASARSSTLLNFCKLNARYIENIYDKNPYKHFYYTPGSQIKILPTSKINKEKDIVILAWNFYEEILLFLKKIKFKGKVIKPLPHKPVIKCKI